MGERVRSEVVYYCCCCPSVFVATGLLGPCHRVCLDCSIAIATDVSALVDIARACLKSCARAFSLFISGKKVCLWAVSLFMKHEKKRKLKQPLYDLHFGLHQRAELITGDAQLLGAQRPFTHFEHSPGHCFQQEPFAYIFRPKSLFHSLSSQQIDTFENNFKSEAFFL